MLWAGLGTHPTVVLIVLASVLCFVGLVWPLGRLIGRMMVKARFEGGIIYVGTPEERRAILRRQVEAFEKDSRPISIVCGIAGVIVLVIAQATHARW